MIVLNKQNSSYIIKIFIYIIIFLLIQTKVYSSDTIAYNYEYYKKLTYNSINEEDVKSVYYAELAFINAFKTKDKDNVNYSLILLGSALLTKSDYTKSIYYFNKAINYAQSTNNYTQLHTIYNNLGVIYKNINDYELAFEYYQKALKCAYKIEDAESIIQTLINIGNIQVLENKYDLGLKYYHSAILEINNNRVLEKNIANIYNNIGYVYLSKQEYHKAEKSFLQAFYYYDSLNNNNAKVVILNNLAELSILSSKYQLAEKYINRAEKLSFDYGLLAARKDLYYTAYELYEASGLYKISLDYLCKYNSLKDSVYTQELNAKIAEQKTIFEVDKLKLESKLKEDKIKTQEKINFSFFIIIIIVVISVILLIVILIQKIRYNNILNISNRELEQKSQEISDNLDYARYIQLACMNNLSQNSNNYFVIDFPKIKVSGDFYLVREKNNKKYYALADCTGHGVSAGFISVLGINFLSYAIDTHDNLTDILYSLNNNLYQFLSENSKLNHDSLCISIISVENKIVEYAGSRHKIWRFNSQTNLIEEFNTNTFIIGAEQDYKFDANIINSNKNDIIYMSSDGYYDQYGGDKNTKLKILNFRKILEKVSSNELQNIKQELISEIECWKGETEQTDDILVLGVKIV